MEWETSDVPAGSVQMIEKPTAFASFLGRRSFIPRPLSTATDFFDLDIDSDGDDSPRSLASLDNGSASTISTREATTPQSAGLGGFEFHFDNKAVEGPYGPHLFSNSPDSFSHQFQEVVPFDPPQRTKTPARPVASVNVPIAELDDTSVTLQYAVDQPRPTGRPMTALNRAVAELDETQVRSWTPRQVADWMSEAGFDSSVVDKFLLHDISGKVLIDLQFEDLKELDISSFGKRHRVMSSIQHLRNSSLISLDTPLERVPSRTSPRAPRTLQRTPKPDECQVVPKSRSQSRRRGRQHREVEADDVAPGESISIVAIEQLLPKPHKCSKGENCPKWQKHQKKLLRIHQEFAAEAADETDVPEESQRPRSYVVPSIIGSSDALGPTVPFKITADRLNEVMMQDPQDSVRQFLSFQHIDSASANLHNPSPPPAASAAYAAKTQEVPKVDDISKTHGFAEQLHDLPKLTIPYPLPDADSPWRTSLTAPQNPTTAQAVAAALLRSDPYHYGGVASPADIYRTDTPFSAADVPVTAHPVDPIDDRVVSSSVPPDMRYGAGQNGASSNVSPPRRRLTKHSFTAPTVTPVKEDFPSTPGLSARSTQKSSDILNHAGWMRKRRTTKMLRHEWTDNYFSLDGTRLIMLQNDLPDSKTIEHIDVDDFSVHAYSVATGRKISTAFKKSILGADYMPSSQPSFAFSLIPDGDKSQPRKLFEKGAKPHHFAVHSGRDKIEWMRRLMLAKAASRNGQGHHEI